MRKPILLWRWMQGSAYDEHGCMTERDPYCAYYRSAIERTVEAFINHIQG